MTWQEYGEKTDSISWLKAHRDWVEQHNYGFGDRPLHYMWYELCQILPDKAVLLEIGVFKGQVISLWALIGKKLKKDFKVWGLTKLDEKMSDKYHTHEIVTQKDIDCICEVFGVKVNIINKDSRDPEATSPENLDLLYIDGGHDEETVRNDIDKFLPSVKKGGLVVFDDASCSLPDFGHWYKGLDDVSRVVDELAQKKDYEEILTVGHNRCFQKLV